jgi:hypothetical protein
MGGFRNRVGGTRGLEHRDRLRNPPPGLANLGRLWLAQRIAMTTMTDTTRWGRIPAWWLDHPDLDADGFAVLAALATFADEHGVCWPSQSTLAAKLKRSRPTINRILQGLADLGLLSIEHRHGRDGARLSCRYRLGFTRDPGATAPVEPRLNRDDSRPDAPCPTASQKHVQPEQNPDSHTGCERTERGYRDMCAVPQDWTPGTDDLAWAGIHHGDVDLVRHVQGFVLRCQAHGYRYRDIGAAWRAWLIQDAAIGKAPRTKMVSPLVTPSTSARSIRDNAPERRLDAWMTVAARLRGTTPAPRF